MMDFDIILSNTFVASAEHHAVLSSTNDRARQCAAEAPPLPCLVVADEQTAGRGRGSNRWWTGCSSLAMSLLLPPDTVPTDRRQSVLLSLAAGIAVVDTLREECPERPSREIGFHWPNDVMLGNRKLAGILIEALADRSHIIGIGINTNSTVIDAPAELRGKLTTLRDVTGRLYDHCKFLLDLVRRFEHELERLDDDPARLIARANELCIQCGQIVSINMGEECVAGCCLGIGPDGALRVETPSGTRECRSGVSR